MSDTSLAALAVHLDDLYALVSQEPRQAGPVGAGPLHPNLRYLAETLQPQQHCLVAGRVRCESLCAEQAANRIERSGDVYIQMGVHAAGDGAYSFYDGHGHPFLLSGQGVARPSPIGATGGPGCSRKPGQSPFLWDGTCRCQYEPGDLGRRVADRSRVCLITSQAGHPVLPRFWVGWGQAGLRGR